MKSKNIKVTKQREMILDELRSVCSHPTAEELYSKVRIKIPRMGLCTVYRNLERFHKEGLIGKIKGKPVRYDGNIDSHNHIKCTHCGKVQDLFIDIPVNTLEIDKLGYKLHSYKLEINGLCRKCYKELGRKKHVKA
jgi:Fur family transcriptional regulator, ferric uptake regulator